MCTPSPGGSNAEHPGTRPRRVPEPRSARYSRDAEAPPPFWACSRNHNAPVIADRLRGEGTVNHNTLQSRWTRHVFAGLALVAFAAASAPLSAQTTKKALTIDDYTKWKSIGGNRISGDGNWVVYELNSSNTPPAEARPVMH